MDTGGGGGGEELKRAKKGKRDIEGRERERGRYEYNLWGCDIEQIPDFVC